ncbi:dihydrofolate reductase family protein [Nocardia sp. NPDC051900]|uniref:dihydrofolate reductase family protein n=1 Tax=Nocardia sp. NPDC051900 TaxID=3364326 RepID=UPI00379F87BB
MSVIVCEFVTLDGRVSDPDGRGGTATGGWAFRYGPETVGGDKFRLAHALDEGVLLLGRRTWELFATIWPGRDDPFAMRMNKAAKLVVSHTLADTSSWTNSTLVEGDLHTAVENAPGDVIVTGSLSIVRALREKDLIDEYRLLIFPTVLGSGDRLFADGEPPADLELLSVDTVGAAVLTRYVRAGR